MNVHRDLDTDLDLYVIGEPHVLHSAVRSTAHGASLCDLGGRATTSKMMALPWDHPDAFDAPSSGSGNDRFDEDLFSAALLFLDHHDSSSDSDSYSTQLTATEFTTTHKRSRNDEPGWETLDEYEHSLDRPSLHVQLKIPRASYTSSPSQGGSTSRDSADGATSVSSHSAPNAGVPLWSPLDAPTPATPRRVNKRRQEINMLRTEAHILQARLDSLRVRAPVDDRDDDEPMINAALGAAWQSVASRQSEQRKLAETENRRLKELVSEHKRTAKTLKRLVARHVNAKTWDPFRAPPHLSDLTTERATALEDPGVFDMLLTSLGPMLQQTDSILANVTASSTPVIKKERHDGSHLTVRYVNSRVVPFGKTETTSAIWDCLLAHDKTTMIEWTDIGDNTFKGQFTAYTRQADCDGHTKAKFLLRRADGHKRTVFIRSTMLQRLATRTKNRFLTVPMRHFEWTVVDQPSSLGSQLRRDALCRIVTCSVTIPRLDVGDLGDPSRAAEIDELEEICSQVSMEQWDEANKRIDNKILDNRSVAAREYPISAAK